MITNRGGCAMNCDRFTTFNVRIDNAVAWVTFDYPPINIQGLPMLADIKTLEQKLEADNTVKVVVFHSVHPEIFFAHADTGFLKDMSGKDLPLSPDLPAVLGMDFDGTVEGVGEGVADFTPVDEVFGCAGGLADLQGTLAEYMPADARLIADKPRTLSMREAAALPLVGITAYEGLVRADARAVQKLLVHDGAGSVGHVAVQLAKHFGAEVYATASSEKHLGVIEQCGATAIDYRADKVAIMSRNIPAVPASMSSSTLSAGPT
jgi:D-arabinose 1-dehydrogenase-like Zn-dependent alcohol dehydrogenase